MIPQLIYIGLCVIGIVYVLKKDGETRKINAGHSLVGSLIIWGLLAWGGFFDPLFK